MEYLQAKVWVFLGSQQLPPEHVDVVGRFLLASRKGRATEVHALFDVVASQKSMHGIVMSLLLCNFSSSRRASYHLSHMAFVFLMPPNRRFFGPVLIDRLAPSSPPTAS